MGNSHIINNYKKQKDSSNYSSHEFNSLHVSIFFVKTILW